MTCIGTAPAGPPPDPPGGDIRARAADAANLARDVLRGPVGEVVYYELDAWRRFGYRFDVDGRGPKLIADIEARSTHARLREALVEIYGLDDGCSDDAIVLAARMNQVDST